MFNFDFVSHIGIETNKYYKECSKIELQNISKLNRCTDTNPDKIY